MLLLRSWSTTFFNKESYLLLSVSRESGGGKCMLVMCSIGGHFLYFLSNFLKILKFFLYQFYLKIPFSVN